MLVIGRGKDEAVTLLVGDQEIKVVVCGIDRGTVRLGIEAPREVKIVRDEIRHRYNPKN